MTSRYSVVHEWANLQGAGDARPTAQQIVDDNDLNGKLVGKVALVTGCSSGIGIETARALKSTGATVYVTVRNVAKGEDALADLLEAGKFEILHCDQNSLRSVEVCAATLLKKTSVLNLLINNAGIMANPTRELTEDGHEAQFGVNHLAHFLLFHRLKPLLLASATPEFPSRVVSVSSSGHRRAPVNLDDLRFDVPDAYDGWKAYGQAKTANIWFANEIERRYGFKNLHANSLHPGGIWTGLQIHMDTSKFKGDPEIEKFMKNVQQGAATTMVAAIDKDLHGKGGLFLEDCTVAEPVAPGPVALGQPGYGPWAYNPEGEARLWKESCKLLGLDDSD